MKHYRDGKKLLLDITVTHVWSATNLSGSSEKTGFAASSKEREKNKYLQRPQALGIFSGLSLLRSLDDGVKQRKRHLKRFRC